MTILINYVTLWTMKPWNQTVNCKRKNKQCVSIYTEKNLNCHYKHQRTQTINNCYYKIQHTQKQPLIAITMITSINCVPYTEKNWNFRNIEKCFAVIIDNNMRSKNLFRSILNRFWDKGTIMFLEIFELFWKILNFVCFDLSLSMVSEF